MSAAHAMLETMTSTLPVLLLFIGLILGAVMGWLAHSYSATRSAPSAEHRALQDSQRRQAELQPLEKAMDRLGFQLQEIEEDRTAARPRLAHVKEVTPSAKGSPAWARP